MFAQKPSLTRVPTFVLTLLATLSFNIELSARQQELDAKADLFEMSMEELMDIEVSTPSKKSEKIWDAPGVVSVVTKEEIRMFGGRNLLDVLRRMPGVYAAGSYMFPQNVVSMRGDMPSHTNNHTLVLINSRPVRESLTGGLNYPVYTGLPIDMVERIEVVRGPGSVLYGTNAYTGVINIITRKGEKGVLTLSGEGGSFGYHKSAISGGTSLGDLSVYGAGHWLSEDGWRFGAVDEAGVSDSMSQGQSGGSIATHVQKGALTFDLFWTKQQLDHLGRAPLWSLAGHEIDVERTFIDLGYRIDLTKRWSVASHVGLNLSGFTFEGGAQERKSEDILGEITVFAKPYDSLNLVGGFVIEHQAAPSLEGSSIQKYSRVPLAAYAQGDYQVLENVKLLGGMQWNKPEDARSDIITHAGAIINITPRWGVKLLRGEAFRAPWPVETSVSNPVLTGNPNLRPEMITTYDAQIFHQRERSQFTVTYFQSEMKDLIARVPAGGGGFTFANGGKMDFWGLELEGKYYIKPELYALGSVTYQDGQEGVGVNPSLVPDTMGKLGLGYESERFSLGVFYSYFSTPPGISGAADVNPDPGGIHWVSANLNLDVTDWIALERGSATLTFRVENLLDQDVHYPEFNRRRIDSLPGDSGIGFYAGLRITF